MRLGMNHLRHKLNVSKKSSQEVAYKVEPDGTVLDAATGEPCGMIELLGCPWDAQRTRNGVTICTI